MRVVLLLGIDVGTSQVKAVLVDRDGSARAAAALPTPFVEGGHGVDMDVAALARVVRDVLAALGPDRERVAAVGIAGLAESGAPMRGRQPLAPIPAWFDGRGEEVARHLAESHPGLALRLGQPLRSVSSVAKLGWMLDQGLPSPDRWLGVPELVLFLLTGAEATEWSLAARTRSSPAGARLSAGSRAGRAGHHGGSLRGGVAGRAGRARHPHGRRGPPARPSDRSGRADGRLRRGKPQPGLA